MTQFLLVLVYISSVVLVLLVASQTTKSEGLGGAIGGGLQSSSKYLPGQEEILQKYTTFTAVAWMVCCLLWFLLSSRQH